MPTLYDKPFPPLRMNKIYSLREQNLKDSDDFLAYYNDPDVYRFIFADIPKDHASALEEVKYCHDLFYLKRGVFWAICEFKTNKMIGTIGFYERDNNQVELCYDLNKKYWSKGITSLAIQTVIEHIIEQRRPEKIFALTTKENAPSIQVLIKNQFRYDQSLTEHRFFEGKFHDVERYIFTGN
jgi:[ribosomal protein S5]-alanine N-acetyltransferase